MDLKTWIHQQSPWWAAPLVPMMLGYAWIKVKDFAQRIPDIVFNRIQAKWAAYVQAGKVDGPTARLVQSTVHNVFDWAEAEFDYLPGPERMNRVIAYLERLPYLGWLVQGNEENVRQLLEIEYGAWKAKIAAEEKKQSPES